MGLLDSFEKGLERAVNSAFAKTFRSGIQPVEIASALRSELDKKAAVVSRDRILAPHTFVVRLSPSDDEKMASLGAALGDELDTLVQNHAKAQGYSFAGPVSISVERDDQLSTGTLRVDSSTAQGRVAWRGVVDVERRYSDGLREAPALCQRVASERYARPQQLLLAHDDAPAPNAG